MAIRRAQGIRKLGLWQSLSVAGKILVVKAEVLPSLFFSCKGVSSAKVAENNTGDYFYIYMGRV